MIAFGKYTALAADYAPHRPVIVHEDKTPPTGATRSWALLSRRGWRQLELKAMSEGRVIAAVVEADGALWMLDAVGKLLANDAFSCAQSAADKRIGRKRYVRLTDALITSILDNGSYFCDGCYRRSSEATVGDTLDIGVWLSGLVGRPTTAAETIARWATGDANRGV